MKLVDIRKKYRVLIGSGISLFLVLTALTLAVGFFFNRTLGWFSMNTNLDVNGMAVKTSGTVFELAVVGEQDDLLDPEDDIESAVIAHMEEHGSMNVTQTGTDANGLLCRLDKEAPITEDEGISPGAFGTISFDIIPKADNLSSIVFTVGFHGIDATNNEVPANSDPIRLASGHILIFESRSAIPDSSEYYYSDMVDGTYTYTFPNNYTANTHYTVTLYWIWPMNFGQMVLTEGDVRINLHPIFADSDSTSRDAFEDFLIDNNSRVFYNITTSFTGLGGSFDLDYHDLGNGYNNADQEIGENIRYISVEFSGVAISAAE